MIMHPKDYAVYQALVVNRVFLARHLADAVLQICGCNL